MERPVIRPTLWNKWKKQYTEVKGVRLEYAMVVDYLLYRYGDLTVKDILKPLWKFLLKLVTTASTNGPWELIKEFDEEMTNETERNEVDSEDESNVYMEDEFTDTDDDDDDDNNNFEVEEEEEDIEEVENGKYEECYERKK